MIRRTKSSIPSLLAVLSLLAVFGLIWGGCSHESSVVGPAEPTLGKKGGKPAPPETFLVLDGAGVEPILIDEGATVTKRLSNLGVLIVEADADLPLRVSGRSDGGGIIIEAPIRTGLSEDIEAIMSFYESFDGSKDYGTERELDVLELPTIHTGGTGAGVQIALLDTRVDFTHPHLVGHLSYTEVDGLEAPDIDLVFGPNRPDAYGHGTHVAGLMVMVAPGARIWPMTVLDDDGIGNSELLAIALDAVLAMKSTGAANFKIVNMSLALEGYSQIVQEAVITLEAAGITMLAGAGNTGDVGRNVVYPAAYPQVIAVGATDGDGIAPFSARDDAQGTRLELGAPGVKVISSYPNGEMHTASGTSMACGVAAGAFAIVMGPVQTNADLSDPTQRLFDTADDIVPLGSLQHGRISLLRALQMLPIAMK